MSSAILTDCNDDVKVVTVHTALGLSVSLLCTYEQQSNSLMVCSCRQTGGHVVGQPCDDRLIVEEEKIKARRERGVKADG